VRTASIFNERSFVDPRGQALATCGTYESDVRSAAQAPSHGNKFGMNGTSLNDARSLDSDKAAFEAASVLTE
jgi:hypothetical protein